MSAKRKRSSYTYSEDDEEQQDIERYCPDYYEYDKRARRESIDRIKQHLSERREGIQKCVDTAVEDAHKLNIMIRNDAPLFIDDETIISLAAKQTNIQINKWDGVQIKQCKKEMIDSFERFAKKAKNHQDQTSWKISGDYFFAPYIKKAQSFLCNLCEYIMDIDDGIRMEIQYLLCLSFANALLDGEIKFHRTKPKPLIRHRTLVKSNGIHSQLEALHPILTVSQRIHNAKKKRKEIMGKSNVIAKDFFNAFKLYTNHHYLRQKRKVYSLLNMEDDDDIDDINDDDHSDNDDDIDIDCSVDTASYTPPIIQSKRRRQFQAIPIRNVSENNQYIANKKKKEIRKQRIDNHCEFVLRKYNETDSLHSTRSLGYVSDINAENNHYNECTDCINTNNSMSTLIDDRSTISTTATSISTMNDYFPPQYTIPRTYHPSYPHQRIALNEDHKLHLLKNENEILRQRILHLRSLVHQRRMYLANINMHRIQQQYIPQQHCIPQQCIPPPITNDEEERMLFPDGTMLKETTTTPSTVLTPMMNDDLQSVDPFPSLPFDKYNASMQFLPNTISPDPTLHLQSEFYRDQSSVL